MKNMAFVIWILLWFPLNSLEDLINAKRESLRGEPKKEYSEGITDFTHFFIFVTWIVVAGLIYEK